jgi:hypothetical protein
MIKAFDKSNLRTLRADIDAAFAALSQKHGVSLSIGTIRYDPTGNEAHTKLTMVAMGDANTAADPRAVAAVKMQSDFKLYASSYGLKPEQYGTTIKHGRESYKLVGFSPRSTRFPILASRLSDGKTFKLPESSIVSLQSKEHKELFGIPNPTTPFGVTPTPTTAGMCSNDNAYDEKYNPIGKCNRPAVTNRKEGFGRSARMQPFCAKCAEMIDEARAENAAEARMS